MINRKFAITLSAVVLFHLAAGTFILLQPGCNSNRPKTAATPQPAAAANVTAQEPVAAAPAPLSLSEPTRPPATQLITPIPVASFGSSSEPLDNNAVNAISLGGGKTTASPGPAVTYVVKEKDTLANIAKMNGVTVPALEAANPGVIPTKLRLGQSLNIPSHGQAEPATSAAAASASGNGKTHKVKSGESLTTIAKAEGTTVPALRSANNLKSDRISIDQVLVLPGASAAAPSASSSDAVTGDSGVYTVRSGDVLDSIAKKFGVKTSE